MDNYSFALNSYNQQFRIRGKTFEECKRKVQATYGNRAIILMQSPLRTGLIFKHEEVEVTGYVPPPPMSRTAEQEKQKILEEAAKKTGIDPKVQEILNEVRLLREEFGATASQTSPAASFEHPNLEQLALLLEQNDFTPAYRKKIMERLRKELALDVIEDMQELEQRTLEYIGETINIYNEAAPRKLPRIIVLVGPTGVGKTTTIAKLASSFMWKFEDGMERKVALITIDLYRLAAARQLEEYAAVLQVPFAAAADEDELKKELALQKGNADIILIDTIGKSPRNAVELAGMKKMLEVCGSGTELHLAVTAATKAADLIEITAQFEPFGYKSVIITKLDETNRVGNVISALAERGKSISYITDGQESTHRTLKKADIVRFLINLEGFEVNRPRLEQRFTQGDYGRSG